MGEEPLASGRHALAERRERFSRFGLAFDTACPASVLYHLHSNLSPEWVCPLSVEDVSTLTLDVTAYKSYPDAVHEIEKTNDLSADTQEKLKKAAAEFISKGTLKA